MVMENHYTFEKDVQTLCESSNLSVEELAGKLGIPPSSFFFFLKDGPSDDVLESFYGFAFRKGMRFNKVKEELFRESLEPGEVLLFHGSKDGLTEIDPNGSRSTCDFSNGFYCGESYSSALCFVESNEKSSVYAFKARLDGLKIGEFKSDLEWMLSVCYYRGMFKGYESNDKLMAIIQKHLDDDVIIAPIADNRMFRVMQQFGQGEITDVQAIHALSASRLGKQYVFKSEKAVSRLKEIERLYLCKEEKKASVAKSKERAYEIQTKLDLSKREYREGGHYIDEVFA